MNVTDVSNHSNNNNTFATNQSILPPIVNKNNNRGVDNFYDIKESPTPP